MKGKNALILLLIIAATCILCSVAYFGIGHKPASADDSLDSAAQQIEIVTDENGEVVTNEAGEIETRLIEVETTTSDETTTAAEGTDSQEAQTYDGYGSVFNIKQGLDLKGGVYIVYQAEKENPTKIRMQWKQRHHPSLTCSPKPYPGHFPTRP